jgi:hypothetical protein
MLEKNPPNSQFLGKSKWEYLLCNYLLTDPGLGTIEMNDNRNIRLRVLHTFLICGADPNQRVSRGCFYCSAIHYVLYEFNDYACSGSVRKRGPDEFFSNLTNVLQVFLDVGADVTTKDSDGTYFVEETVLSKIEAARSGKSSEKREPTVRDLSLSSPLGTRQGHKVQSLKYAKLKLKDPKTSAFLVRDMNENSVNNFNLRFGSLYLTLVEGEPPLVLEIKPSYADTD